MRSMDFPHIRTFGGAFGGGLSSVRSANTQVSQAIILLNPDYPALPPPPRTLIIALSLCIPTTYVPLRYTSSCCYLHIFEMSGKIPHLMVPSQPCTKDLTFHCSAFERGEVGGAENTTAMGTLGALSILYFWYCVFLVFYICNLYLYFRYVLFVLGFCISVYLCFFSLLWSA